MIMATYSFHSLLEQIRQRNLPFSYGEKIHSHTAKKIELISKYVDNWLYVASNSDIKDIYFIDVMSNSGLYESGELATYVEVLNRFVIYALKHKEKNYHLICNDYDDNKYKTIVSVKSVFASMLTESNICNVSIECNNKDASQLLNDLAFRFSSYYSKRLILLFVDPYCMIDFELASSIINFCKKVYSELILNYFYNDYIRNYKNKKAPNKMKDIEEFSTNICGLNPLSNHPDMVMNKFIDVLITKTKLKYRYAFKMRNSCNGILYYLLYLTPSISGLIKIKEATWKTFKYNTEYSPLYVERDYLNIFGQTEDEENESYIFKDIKDYLLDKKGLTYSFEQIETFVLQNTPLPSGKVINAIIKPLINEGLLLKQNNNGKSNFKKDNYIVI